VSKETARFEATTARLSAFLDDLLRPLRELAVLVVDDVGPFDEPLPEGRFESLAAWLRDAVEEHPLAAGIGFAAAPGVVVGHDHFLYWMQRQRTGIRRLALNLTEGDPDLYEYHEMDWFAGARAKHGPAVYGPYVDYAGSDLVVITAALPVYVGERFVGVAGGDFPVEGVEDEVIRALRGLSPDALVVTGDRSIVAAGSPRWMPGERLAVLPAAEPAAYLSLAALGDWSGWTLAVATPAPGS
jgi:hypothetical protein